MTGGRRIVVIGGYGAFGALVAERLVRGGGCEVVIAGRSEVRGRAAAAELGTRFGCKVGSAAVDAALVTAAELVALAAGHAPHGRAAVVVNASGPFQGADYGLARACIEARCHYVDLADGRAFVTGIAALDRDAKAAGVCVISGASTVPGVSSAVVAAFRGAFSRLEGIEIAVSPGNHFQPGEATVKSILGYVGRPIAMRVDGAARTVYGWQGVTRVPIEGLGSRLMGYCEVPDLDLYPGVGTVVMRAGVEVVPFHLGLWAVSWLVRAGLVRDLAAWSGVLMRAKTWGARLGSDRGGMVVAMTGRGADGLQQTLGWHLVAGSGHGPYIPAMASVILARKLARGGAVSCGAMACFEAFSLEEFMAEVAGLDIAATVVS
ncbi:MAG: saccharopine dehydrogenase NADP-binding domain-containing protein [Hyphomicrobiaceae bacterium]